MKYMSETNHSQNIRENGRSHLNPFTILTHHQTNLAALLFFIVLTVIAAWPILTNLDSVIIGNDDDIYVNLWADWWTAKAWQDPTISLWHTEMIFYPQGANLIYHSFSHLNTLISLGLRPFLGILPAYNVTILLNFVLNGFSMYQLARFLTRSAAAGFLAGIVFAFNSHGLYQSAHPVLISMWCIPWTTLYYLRAVRANNGKWAILAAFFVFLGAAASTILIILLVFWLALLTLYLFAVSDEKRPSGRVLLTFGGLSALFVLPLVWPLLKDAIVNQNDSFVINPLSSIVTSIPSIFIPHWYQWAIRGMYLGIVPFGLGLLAVWRQWRPVRLWLLLTVVAYFFAIGPRPVFFGEYLDIVLPWSALLASMLHHMYRMMILMSLGWAMMTAFGWLALVNLFKLRKTSRWLMAFGIGAAIFLEFTAVPFPHRSAAVSPFYTDYLDKIPDDVVLAILPTGRQFDKRYMYYQTLHEHPMTGGVVSRSQPGTLRFIASHPLLRAGAVDTAPAPLPDNIDAAFAELAAYRIGFLVLEKNGRLDIDVWRSAIKRPPVYEDHETLVYATGILP